MSSLPANAQGLRGLEIRRQAVDFPVAVAGRIEAAAARDFLRCIGVLGCSIGAASRGLRQRPFGRRRQRALAGFLIFVRACCGRFLWRLVVCWHRLSLGVALPLPQGGSVIADRREAASPESTLTERAGHVRIVIMDSGLLAALGPGMTA